MMGGVWCSDPAPSVTPSLPPPPPARFEALRVHKVEDALASFHDAIEYEPDKDAFLIHATDHFGVFRWSIPAKKWMFLFDGSLLVRFGGFRTAALTTYTSFDFATTKTTDYTVPVECVQVFNDINDSKTGVSIVPLQGWSAKMLLAALRQMRREARGQARAPPAVQQARVVWFGP